LFGDFAPALLADRKVFAFYLDVEFDVFAFAGFFPRVFTVFQVISLWNSDSEFFAFKRIVQPTVTWWGEVGESKT
jgi:hypothetical protein